MTRGLKTFFEFCLHFLHMTPSFWDEKDRFGFFCSEKTHFGVFFLVGSLFTSRMYPFHTVTQQAGKKIPASVVRFRCPWRDCESLDKNKTIEIR